MSMNIMNLAVSDAGKKGHCDECGEIPKDPFFIFGFLLFFLLCYAYFFSLFFLFIPLTASLPPEIKRHNNGV